MGGVVFPPCYLTWGQTVVELMNIMSWTSFERSKHGLLRSVPPALQQALASTRDSWTLTGKSGSVSCGVTAPLSWVLVHTKFCLCLQESVSPVLCKFWWLCVGLMATSSQGAYAIPRSTAPRALALAAVPCWPVPHRRHSNTVLSQSLWGLWVLVDPRFVWALWASLAGMGFDSKCDFTILPLLPFCWGFSFALRLGVSPQSHSSAVIFINSTIVWPQVK